MQNLAHQAYGTVQHRTASDKEIEQALMAQITNELEEVSNAESPSRTQWFEAISRNLQMWTIFTADLLNPNNQLPEELRSQILFLGEFVRQQSRALFAAGEGDLSEIIAINKILLGKTITQISEVA